MSSSGVTVIVRALDKAGNVRDESVDVRPPTAFGQFLEDYLMWLLLIVLLLIILGFAIRYFYGHHIIENLQKAWALVRRDIAREEMKEAEKDAAAVSDVPPTVSERKVDAVPKKDEEQGLSGS